MITIIISLVLSILINPTFLVSIHRSTQEIITTKVIIIVIIIIITEDKKGISKRKITNRTINSSNLDVVILIQTITITTTQIQILILIK